jgi:hypothetical protein
MWICPKCKENIEDQFDSCWKCAGATWHEPPPNDSVIVWMYPAISLLPQCLIDPFAGLFWHGRYDPGYFNIGGAVMGCIVSAVCTWAFLSCPLRHWFVKLLTLFFLIPALGLGVVTIGSFIIHVLGYGAA